MPPAAMATSCRPPPRMHGETRPGERPRHRHPRGLRGLPAAPSDGGEVTVWEGVGGGGYGFLVAPELPERGSNAGSLRFVCSPIHKYSEIDETLSIH